MHLHSDKIFFPNSCHHSINTPWNVPKKIMNASSEPKRVNSLVPSVNFLILHIKSYHYQNTNNASFVVYVIQSQHYQNTNNASFVVYILVLKNCRHLYLDKLKNLPVRTKDQLYLKIVGILPSNFTNFCLLLANVPIGCL